MKKIKLFLSICMMCLCVAVLCMGILAASSATYNINGNISYNMVDDIALVNTRVYKVADQKTETELGTTATTLSTMTFEAIESSTDLGFILSQKLDTKATLSNGATFGEVSSGAINIDFGATDSSVWYYTFYIVINITDLTNKGELSVALTDNTTYASVITKVIDTSQMTTIAYNETKNIVIGLSIESTTTDEIDTAVNYSLSLSYTAYECTLDGTTIYFTTNMTWAEYIDSLTDSSLEYGGTYVKKGTQAVQLNSTAVIPTEKMTIGGTYTLKTYSFTLDSTSYIFYPGMTWTEYVATLSDSSSFDTSRTYLMYDSKIVQLNSTDVTPNDEIVDGGDYSVLSLITFYIAEKNSTSNTWEVVSTNTVSAGSTWEEYVETLTKSDGYYLLDGSFPLAVGTHAGSYTVVKYDRSKNYPQLYYENTLSTYVKPSEEIQSITYYVSPSGGGGSK